MKGILCNARLAMALWVPLLTACAGPVMAPKTEGELGRPLVTSGWTATEGMDAPESAHFDPTTGFLFVSQITGELEGRDGTGRIAKLDGRGHVIDAAWATGLNAPKGLRVCGETLWTADLDEVVGVAKDSGQITERVKIDGAKFLNDVACSPDGRVFVSDMLASRIFTVEGGVVSVLVEGEDIEYPNGLLVEGDRLVVGGWGEPNAGSSTAPLGRLFTIDLVTRRKTLITPLPFANIDGVEQDGRGGYIVSDWKAGKVAQVSASGVVTPLLDLSPGVADFSFLPGQDTLILPHMKENKVVAYDLSPMLTKIKENP